jgi:serine/threonine-protein kinase HipA
MNREGKWSLSPAFDLNYAYDPHGRWTKNHQLSLNGKFSEFSRGDFIEFGKVCNLSGRAANAIVDRTLDAFSAFNKLAVEHELPPALKKTVAAAINFTHLT